MCVFTWNNIELWDIFTLPFSPTWCKTYIVFPYTILSQRGQHGNEDNWQSSPWFNFADGDCVGLKSPRWMHIHVHVHVCMSATLHMYMGLVCVAVCIHNDYVPASTIISKKCFPFILPHFMVLIWCCDPVNDSYPNYKAVDTRGCLGSKGSRSHNCFPMTNMDISIIQQLPLLSRELGLKLKLSQVCCLMYTFIQKLKPTYRSIH